MLPAARVLRSPAGQCSRVQKNSHTHTSRVVQFVMPSRPTGHYKGMLRTSTKANGMHTRSISTRACGDFGDRIDTVGFRNPPSPTSSATWPPTYRCGHSKHFRVACAFLGANMKWSKTRQQVSSDQQDDSLHMMCMRSARVSLHNNVVHIHASHTGRAWAPWAGPVMASDRLGQTRANLVG